MKYRTTPNEDELAYCKKLRDTALELKTQTTYTNEQIENFDRLQISLVITAFRCEIFDSLRANPNPKHDVHHYMSRSNEEFRAYREHRKVLNPDAPVPELLTPLEFVKRHRKSVKPIPHRD